MTHRKVSSLWPKFLFAVLILAPAIALADDFVEVSGIVVDEGGQPVAEVRVTPLSQLPTTPGVTDAEGKFTVKYSALDRGPNALLARNAEGTRQGYVSLPEAPWLEAAERPLPVLVKIQLKPARELAAAVADELGTPIAGATVTVVGSYQRLAEDSTDKAGHATLRVPADAQLDAIAARKDEVGLDYFVFRQPRDRGSDPYKLAADFSGPFKFVLEGIRSMRVRLVDGMSEPVPGIEVYPGTIMLPKKGDGAQVPGTKLVTDKNGVANFRFIPKGMTQSVNFWQLSLSHAAQERILFDPASKDDEVTATVLPIVKLSGRVVMADSDPVSGAFVFVHGEGYQFDGFHRQTKTDAEGRFTLAAHPHQYLTFQAAKGNLCSGLESYIVLDKPPEKEIELKVQPGTRVFGRATVGADRRPFADQHVQLYQSPTTDYYRLPKAEQLPNPRGERKGITTGIARNATTNMEGQFEFWAPPGNHSLRAGASPTVKVKVTAEKEINVDLPSSTAEPVVFKGRVVLADSKKPVPDATIDTNTITSQFSGFRAATDEKGEFTGKLREPSALMLRAATPDGKLIGIVRTAADATSVEIPVRPPTTVRGKLVTGEKGDQPLAGKGIQWGLQIDGRSYSVNLTDQTTTSETGEFEVRGLCPGATYTLRLVLKSRKLGGVSMPAETREFATFTPEVGATEVELPEIAIRFPAESAGVESLVDTKFKSDEAPQRRLEPVLRKVQLCDARILWVATKLQHPVCVDFTKILYQIDRDERNPEMIRAFGSYYVMGIDAQGSQAPAWQAEFAARKLEWPPANEALFVILDPKGKVIAQKTAGELSTSGKLVESKLIDFLNGNLPAFPDARQTFAAALERAKREDKRVLLQQSGLHCAPCLRLAGYLEANEQLLGKDYVLVKVDHRFANGKEVIEELRPKSGGIPWTVILDAEGKPLIDSDGPEGNIGYPGSVAGKKHFEKMLNSTARRLSAKEIQTLISKLEE